MGLDAHYSPNGRDYSGVTGPPHEADLEVDASGALLVSASTRTMSSQATFAAAAAGDYADNDVISQSASNGVGVAREFALAVSTPGGSARIIGGSINFVAAGAIGASVGLQLFSQTPTATELDDNAAEGGVGAADAPYYLGEIVFAAGTDYGAGTILYPSAVTPAAPLTIRAASGSRSIFGRLIFRDAEAGETAGMSVVTTLYIE